MTILYRLPICSDPGSAISTCAATCCCSPEPLALYRHLTRDLEEMQEGAKGAFDPKMLLIQTQLESTQRELSALQVLIILIYYNISFVS